MSGHTPGPWHDDGYRIYAPTEDSDKRNGRVIVDYKHIPDFNHADARLIAAAPALLAFAEWILESYHSEDGMPEAKIMAREARAAIAKAKGEA